MFLYERQTQFEDLPECAQLIKDDLKDKDPEFATGLVELWTQLLEARSALSSVVEDRNQGRRIVGFGFSICVSDGFVGDAMKSQLPYLPHRLIQEQREGKQSWLDLKDIRQANKKDGLNVVVLHTIMGLPDMAEHQQAEVRDRMLRSLFVHHQGYKIKTFLKEVYGVEERERSFSFGFQEINAYPAFEYTAQEYDHRPYLLGLTREEALNPQYEGKYIRELFRYTPPICSFTPGDQELIQLALAGLSESTIATVLGISHDSVKSRWDSVYSHVPYKLEKELFHGQAGLLKSRTLLNWLRGQPEEWRPTLFFKGLNLVGDVPR